MSDPSTSKNVSSRRTRVTRKAESEEDDIQIVQKSALKTVDINNERKNAILEMIQKNSQQKMKLTSSNCFETKSPLDLYNVEEIIASNVKIQDMAIVLDTTQQIYSARVDRLFTEVRGCEISMTRGSFPKDDDTAEGGASKKKSKSKNLEENTDQLQNVLNTFWHPDNVGGDNQGENVQEGASPAVSKDPVADLEWQEEWDIGNTIKQLLNQRIANAEKDIFTSASPSCLIDSKSFEIANSDIDWLQSNTYYQKAMVGSVDDGTSSFHSLLSNGMYSNDGRVFKLHPRISESPADRPITASQVNADVVLNTRKLIRNSMVSIPEDFVEKFCFDTVNRQRTGQFRPKRQEVQVSRANTTTSQDTTMQDLTIMIPAERAASVGPSNMQDTTMFGAASPPEVSSINTVVSEAAPAEQAGSSLTKSGALRASEYEVPPFTDILIDEYVDLTAHEEFKTDGLEAILHVKANFVEEGEDESKKGWRRGMLAEEWFDPTYDMSRECQNVLFGGIDSNIKYAESMVNSDVVKMVFNNETIHKLDQELRNLENEIGSSNVTVKCPSIPDRYFILKKSEAYKTLYPPDRKDYFSQITHDEDDEENIPIAMEEEAEEDEGADEPIDDLFGDRELVFNETLAADNSFDDAGAGLEHAVGGEEDPVAEGFFGAEEQPPVDTVHRLAVDQAEVADLATNLITEPAIEIRPEMETEIQNLGKDDNAHWKAPLVNAAESITTLAKKRKEKKTRKRVTVDDFAHYFETTTDVDKSEKISEVLCKPSKTAPWILKESQVLCAAIPIESKPFIAFEFEQLSRSGVMFRKKYGKLKFGRELMERKHNEDVYIEEADAEDDSECLNWLLTFSGFRCFDIASQTENAARIQNEDDQVFVSIEEPTHYYDDNDDYDEEYLRQEAMLKMSESTSQKFLNIAREADNMRVLYNKLNRREEEYSDDDEENDENRENYFGQRNAYRAKNLDAAKHKKCIADVLNSPVLTAQNIDYMLLKLSEGSLTATGQLRNPRQHSVLESVFKFKSHDVTVGVDEIIEAFNAVPDYNDAESGVAGTMADRLNQIATTTPIDPSNPPVERVQVAGVKTFLSVVTCAPSKMGDISSPAGLLSFSLHLCNENGIHLFQDRTQPYWMNDFVFVNKGGEVPNSIIVGDGGNTHFLTETCYDPFGSMYDDSQPGPSRSLKPAENPDLSNIVEEDEEEEEELQEDA